MSDNNGSGSAPDEGYEFIVGKAGEAAAFYGETAYLVDQTEEGWRIRRASDGVATLIGIVAFDELDDDHDLRSSVLLTIQTRLRLEGRR